MYIHYSTTLKVSFSTPRHNYTARYVPRRAILSYVPRSDRPTNQSLPSVWWYKYLGILYRLSPEIYLHVG